MIPKTPSCLRLSNPFYGGQSLHNYSHGESFFTLLEHRFHGDGLFLLDEPEAALSTQRQLAALALILETVRKYPDAQFIIATHSPILLAAPYAQIFSFDSGQHPPHRLRRHAFSSRSHAASSTIRPAFSKDSPSP